MKKLLEKIDQLERETKDWELEEYRKEQIEEWDRGYYKGYYSALNAIKKYINNDESINNEQ